MFGFSLDLKKYKKYSGKSSIVLFFTQQGLWALFVYRFYNAVYTGKLPKIIKSLILLFGVLHQKWIEIVTGISIPYSASIGHSFYIGHFGNIIINSKSVIGSNCNISQGVTIGVSGRGEKRGVPVIGDNVYMGANATIAGSIAVGNGAVIGANSLVISNVAAGTTVVGVPAEQVSSNDSNDYI
ncbi:serine O-acetyltransferase [Ulvibacter litoralis]|uniref:Serine acetyltransferase n=1 Tax=Ulvibacter litoralis TaxID=227084 RepID=A0A1G7GW94_9FLAO|nr:serine acetyltransferase [Ulvibacter litoralis]GHC59893.1 serine acetyltransferase [Ulvibacter litoralis]SDE92426.1 serine O-acetyltransferase [Ulvibacter litoralis]